MLHARINLIYLAGLLGIMFVSCSGATSVPTPTIAEQLDNKTGGEID